MNKIKEIHAKIRESRELIIKTMQERGIKDVELVMSQEDFAKENGFEDPDDCECDYSDYKFNEAPCAVFFDKYGAGHDYRVLKVTLEGEEHPHFMMECEADEIGDDTFYEDDMMPLSMVNVYEAMCEELKIEDEPECVWVFTANQALDDEMLDVLTKVFATEEEAKSYLYDFVHGEDGELEYAEKRGWTIECDYADWFQAYEEGYYCGNHTEVQIEKLEVQKTSEKGK